MKKVKDVNMYIETAPIEVRDRLQQLRKIIKEVVPDAEEKISYSMPAYKHHGYLAFFAHAKTHVGLYIPPPIIQEFQRELKGYKTAKATIQFPLDEELPIALIKQLLVARKKFNETNSKKN